MIAPWTWPVVCPNCGGHPQYSIAEGARERIACKCGVSGPWAVDDGEHTFCEARRAWNRAFAWRGGGGAGPRLAAVEDRVQKLAVAADRIADRLAALEDMAKVASATVRHHAKIDGPARDRILDALISDVENFRRMTADTCEQLGRRLAALEAQATGDLR